VISFSSFFRSEQLIAFSLEIAGIENIIGIYGALYIHEHRMGCRSISLLEKGHAGSSLTDLT
jgi:hypothetical protein